MDRRDPPKQRWAELTQFRDRLTAGMTRTYLEEAGVEARVAERGGLYCVEVPEDQLGEALLSYEPADSNVVPAMDEARRSGDTPTPGDFKYRPPPDEKERLTHAANVLRWVFRIVVVLVLIALLVVILLG